MKNLRHCASLVLITLTAVIACADDEVSDGETYSMIRDEVQRASSIDNSLVHLADVYGPRLTGTPRYLQMVRWVEQQLKDWGIDTVRIESYGEGRRGWEVEHFSAAMTSPVFASLNAQPVCCGHSLDDGVSGVPSLVDFYDLDALQALSGQLQGKILMLPEVTPLGDPATGRWADETLKIAGERTDPITPDGLDGPGSDVTYVERLRERMAAEEDEGRIIAQYLQEQGVAALLRSSAVPAGVVNNRFDSGMIEFHAAGDPKPVPMFVLPREQHARLLSLLSVGESPSVSLSLQTIYYEDPELHVNLIAEIPGTDPDLKDEIVMLGAHLDSVETATGAADNGIGSATSMELLRVLQALDLKPRRTIRIALWGGEEQDLLGSSAYVKRHIGDIMTGEYFGEHERISAYFNHDNNGHDIRGIFVVGHDAIKPIFQNIFAPFAEVGGGTVTIENACCTDIVVFDATGIPSFEWIHDPGNYFTHQLHTNLDVPSLVSTESANRNAAIIATAVYQTAMLDEMLPRKSN